MPTTQIDEPTFKRLLEPISEDSPTGSSIKLDFGTPLNALKEARDEAEKCENAFRKWQIEELENRPEAKADWKAVIEKAVNLLTTESKDLRAVAWLTEGLIRVDGISGLRQALSFFVELTNRFWEKLHPCPDSDAGHSDAVSGLKKLFSDLTVKALDDLTFIQDTPPRPDTPPKRITFHQHENLGNYDKLTDEELKERRRERLGWVSTAEYRKVAEKTAIDQLKEAFKDLSEAIKLTDLLGEFLESKCRPDRYKELTFSASETSGVKKQIGKMAEAVGNLLQELENINAEGQKATHLDFAEPHSGDDDAASSATYGYKSIATREDAFQAIEGIAAYFEQREPHTPVHFALRQIVRWGRMSLSELLKELLEDDKAFQSVSKRVGLRPPPPDN